MSFLLGSMSKELQITKMTSLFYRDRCQNLTKDKSYFFRTSDSFLMNN
jgi:hypothetical protein